MKTRHRFSFVLLILLAAMAPLSRAGAELLPPLTAEDAPLTEAQRKKVRQLILQLGDVKWAKRQEAADSLEKIGEPVLPFLKEALKDSDAEIQARAEALIAAITPAVQVEDSAVIVAKGGLRITGNFVMRGNMTLASGPVDIIALTTTARFLFKGHQFTVVRKFDGKTISLVIEISEKDKEKPWHVETTGEEDLERKEPELFKIYKKRLGDLAERQAKMRAEYSKSTGIP